jgi:hypothetical protein
MKASVKGKTIARHVRRMKDNSQTASLPMRYEVILARTLIHEFMLSMELNLDSMHLSVFSPDDLIQVAKGAKTISKV